MAWSDTTFHANFASAVGATLAGLSDTAQELLWFNEGQARLGFYLPLVDTLTWVETDTEIDLPTDFVQLRKIIFDTGISHQSWYVFGQKLVIDHPDGATQDGTGRIQYWASWPELSSSVDSLLSLSLDYACLSYAQFKFYKLLSSNRAFYKRYASQVGTNAVSMTDLQQEADRHYTDYLDQREDYRPEAPALAFES
jgi:hypothetical protein